VTSMQIHQIIQKEFQGLADVVIEPGHLIAACDTKAKFKIGLSKLSGLLKTGGTFMMYAPEFTTMEKELEEYVVAFMKYPLLCVTGEFLATTLKEQGFTDVNVQRCAIDAETLAKRYEV